MTFTIARRSLLAGAALLMAGASLPAMAQDASNLRILISQSPWLNSFTALLDEYQAETGVTFQLDVTPFGGMMEKARNSLRSPDGAYDFMAINSNGMAELYASGYLRPIHELDPDYTPEAGVLSFGNTSYWNETTQSFDASGQLMGLPINGNVQVLYYRTDLYEAAGLSVPETWDDLLANAQALNDAPNVYGFVPRAARDSILYNWTPYLFSHDGSFFADPAAGDYSVTLASPEALKALEVYLQLGNETGPTNFGAIAQAELTQLLATGKAAQAIGVMAIYSNLEDENSSVVAGRIGTALLPAGPNGTRSSAAGHWMAGISANIPEANQVAALDFLKWFLAREQQIEYVRAGGVPVRSDLTGDGLETEEGFEFLPAFSGNAEVAQMNMPLIPGTQLNNAISVWLNRAAIGEITPAEALNGAAMESHQILVDAGYTVQPPSSL
jgi:multiple sugar transport system substrate-binding protein